MSERRRMFFHFKMVEYLESTNGGGQRIDSGVLFDGLDDIIITAKIARLNSSRFIVASSLGNFRSNFNCFSLEISNNQKARAYYQNKDYQDYDLRSTDTIPLNTPVILSAHYQKNTKIELKYNITYSTAIAAHATVQNHENFNLFLDKRINASPIKYAGRIYYLQILKGGAVVRDFIPVEVGGVGYMYDKVSKRLFGNSGTGTFVVGPRID